MPHLAVVDLEDGPARGLGRGDHLLYGDSSLELWDTQRVGTSRHDTKPVAREASPGHVLWGEQEGCTVSHVYATVRLAVPVACTRVLRILCWAIPAMAMLIAGKNAYTS